MKIMSVEEQLQLWVDGKPTHMGERGDPESQCTPDFSCCQPELLQPPEVRKAFQAADESARMKFLGVFLQAAMASYCPDKKVHIAGQEESQ